jgi:hypothetical protein
VNRNSTTDRYRSPMRVSHEPVLATTTVHRSPLSLSTGSPSPILARLPPRKT